MVDTKLKIICSKCPVEPFCDFVKREAINDIKEEFCPLLALLKREVILYCGIREHGKPVWDYTLDNK